MSPPRAASAEKTERTSDPDLHERSRRGGSSAEVAVAAPGGLTLTWAFVLSVGAAVALATLAASVLNYALAMRAADQALDIAGSSAALNAAAESGVKWDPQGNASTFRDVQVQPAQISRRGQVVSGVVYRASRRELNGTVSSFDVVIDGAGDDFRQALLLSLVLSSVVVVGVGIGVAFLISRRVVAPVAALIEDIRVLSHGNLDHRVRVQAGGELGLLAKSVDRMIRGLRDAREAEREREQQEHELALASEIRSSLLPEGVPALPGYEIAAHGAAADSVGGDLFDYVPNAGGGSRFGVFVAGISARGVPGAMLMTMARAYLHDAAERYPSPSEALKAANRPITRDMRRGLFVTAIAAVLEPETGRVLVASAGHKAPLLHWVAAEHKLRMVHPEGIALGFDPGPVFDRTIREAEIQLAPGDRIVCTTAGAFSVRNAQGEELGEKGFFAIVGKHANKSSEAFCQLVGSETERLTEGLPLEEDIVIVTVKRKGKPAA